MTGVGDVVVSQGNPGGLMPSLWSFKKYGESGIEVSDLFPHVAEHVDDLAVLRSMHAISNDHGPALYQMNTGTVLAGHPSVGSWLTYGLGTENENLPGFVVFTDYRGGPIGGAPNWGNGYMPAAYQGTQFRSVGDAIVDLRPPKDVSDERQRRWLDLLGDLNRKHLEQNPADTDLSARIASYELAYRMQTHASDANRCQQGVGGHPQDVWAGREDHQLLRAPGPDGAPPRGKGCAVRAALLGWGKL